MYIVRLGGFRVGKYTNKKVTLTRENGEIFDKDRAKIVATAVVGRIIKI